VQKGAFGACLMAEPELVAASVSSISNAVSMPVTVKHRIGIDQVQEYSFLKRFVSVVSAAGCKTFIVHARNAVLKGLSPKENREIPPLKYDYVYRLKDDFPQLEIVINGGITTWADITRHLAYVDGVMLGRAAYHNPWLLADAGKSRSEVVRAMFEYAKGVESLRHVTRHMLGLYHGHRKARLWRRILSDSERLKHNRPELLLEALELVETPGYTAFTPA
jgi:tRNA-dihydrouridine synthase A